LSPFTSERLLAPDRMRAPNPECPVCSVAQTTLYVDISRTTLNDVVEDFLRLELGYGEEFVVNNDVGTLYDVEETDNLAKKLIDLGAYPLSREDTADGEKGSRVILFSQSLTKTRRTRGSISS
jgi:ubiquitin-like 1-activating enzyme E1 B